MSPSRLLAGYLTLLVAICGVECEESIVRTALRPPAYEGPGRNESKDDDDDDDDDDWRSSRWDENALSTIARGVRAVYRDCHGRVKQRLQRMMASDGEGGNPSSRIGLRLRLLANCLKVAVFRRADEFLSRNVIPLTPTAELRRNANVDAGEVRSIDILRRTWVDLVAERLENFLAEYSLRIRLDGAASDVSGRGRRRDHRMLAMIMMGFIIMSSVLVPMGFQFLAVLGGKSLLLAKMALIMSAINGLKKIATSNVGYGLYHTVPETIHHEPHHHGFHEKFFQAKSQEEPDLSYNVVV